MSTDATLPPNGTSSPNTAALPSDIETCHAVIRELLSTLQKTEYLNGKLQHQLEQLLRARYGKKSEKLDPRQLLLFAEAFLAEQADEAPAKPDPPEGTPDPPEGTPDPPEGTPKRPPSRGHGRGKLPASLPRTRIEYDLPEAQKTCPSCQHPLAKIGEETSEQVEYIPASVVVLEHARLKYACRHCEEHVETAAKLPAPIERGLPGPGMLAHIATSKYADHIPLYRQEGQFRRHGLELSRKTMCDWMARVAELVAPIVALMRNKVLQSRVIQTDDTTVPVQDPRHPKKTKTGRLWAYLGDRQHPYTVFDFTPDRSRDGPQRWLDGYKGFLQADAYKGYDAIFARGEVAEIACWAHARRYFFDAKATDSLRAHHALAVIGQFYQVERDAKEQAEKSQAEDTAAKLEELRLELRHERSVDLLRQLRTWLEEESGKAIPKSPIGQAIAYALSNWDALGRYTQAGYFDIDNNASERAMKVVVLGRKNWLFAGSDEGGATAATLFSITVTCKRLGIDPFAYLRSLLDLVSTHPANRIEELLPDRWAATPVAKAVG